MRRKLLVFLIFSAFSAFATGQVSISMIHLLVYGDRFDGARVEVFGYIGGFRSPALYLTKDHANDPVSSVYLEVSDAMIEDFLKCRSRYVKVVGDVIIDEGILFVGNIGSIYDSERGEYCYNKQDQDHPRGKSQ